MRKWILTALTLLLLLCCPADGAFAAEEAAELPPSADAAPAIDEPIAIDEAAEGLVTVTFRDGAETLLCQSLPLGETPGEVPWVRASGEPVLGWVADGRRVPDPAVVPVTADMVYAVWTPPVWTREHVAYAAGRSDGTFGPDEQLTRGDAAVMLRALLPGALPGPCASDYTDLAAEDPRAGAIRLLSSLGVLSGYPDGTFRPDDGITRAELVSLLAATVPAEAGALPFTDVAEDHWARRAIGTAVRRGWVRGYGDGTFRPDGLVTRAEGVCLLNAMLGRSAAAAESRALLADMGVWVYADVGPEEWYYPQVMEATLSHSFVSQRGAERWTALSYRSCGFPAGIRLLGGRLYLVDENRQISALVTGQLTYGGRTYCAAADGTPLPEGPLWREDGLYCVGADGALVTDGDYGLLHFGPDGRYTSGNDELDSLVDALLDSCVSPGDSREAALRAAFEYIRDTYTYLGRDHLARGAVGWEEESALFILHNGKGNCYCFSACFLYAARRLGFQAMAVSGGVGRKNDDHAWVMIGDRFFDPELEYAYRYRYETRRIYDLYDKTRAEMPFTYVFPEAS